MCGPSNTWGQWSPLTVVSGLLLNVGTIMLIIAVASRQWIVGKDGRLDELEFGLFKACRLEPAAGDDRIDDNSNTMERKCQSPSDYVETTWGTNWVPGMQCIFIFALVTAILATVILDLYLVLPIENLRRKPGPPFVVLCFNIAAFVLGLTGGIIIIIRQLNSSEFDLTRLDWAFRLSMAAKTLFLVSLVLLLVEYHRLLLLATDRRLERNTTRNAEGYELTGMNGSPSQQAAAHAQSPRGAHGADAQAHGRFPQAVSYPREPQGRVPQAVRYPRESQGAGRYPQPVPSYPKGVDNPGFAGDEPKGAAAMLPLEPRDETGLTGMRREKMKYY